MRIGVISDTHGRLDSRVAGLFAGVDHIVHGGDVGSLEVLAELEHMAPLTAVVGNTDGGEVAARLPRVATGVVEVGGGGGGAGGGGRDCSVQSMKFGRYDPLCRSILRNASGRSDS